MTQTLPTAVSEITTPCTFGECTNTATTFTTTSYPEKPGREAFDWLGNLCDDCLPFEREIAALAVATFRSKPIAVTA